MPGLGEVLKTRFKVFFFWVVLSFSFSLRAEWLPDHNPGQRGPMVLTLDPSVRSQGLGGAFVAPADDGGALFWNPAGLQKLPRQEVGFAHAALFGEQTQDSAVYVRPAWRFGERETWAVGLTHLADTPLELSEEGESRGTARPSESVVSLGYARPLGFISFGVSGKYIRQVSFEEVGSAFALDMGLQGAVGARAGWGVSLANLGTKMSLGDSGTPLPLVIRAGGMGTYPFFNRGSLMGSLQFDLPADDVVRGGAGLEYDRSLGRDWSASLRTGYSSDVAARFSLGAGLEKNGLGVNVAYSPDDDLGASTRMDLRWRFGQPLAQEIRRRDLLDHTKRALEKGELSEAEGFLMEARALSPRSRRVRQLDREMSLQIADSLDTTLLREQARRSLEKGDLGGAELAYRKILLVLPGNVEAQKGLDHIAAVSAARRTEEARVAVTRAKERKKLDLIGRARETMKRGDWTSARDLWQAVLELDPANETAREEMARCQKAIALEAQARALEAEARKAEGLRKYEEGRTAYQAGNLSGAKMLFEDAVRLDPNNATFRRALERAQQENKPRVP